ncbi:O-antigen ligase family protein [Comamonas jiangduensis]|uniref:O-antigen ligase family protein n=1 Tax=Comamonas jiangduensis TaxID=1194168 RepID=UPI0024E0986B|nr:O-antigen ligase family protein [Comamonas jiangduensis]
METTAVFGLLICIIPLLPKNIKINRASVIFLISMIFLITFDLTKRSNIYYGDYILGAGYFLIFFLSVLVGININERVDLFFFIVIAFAVISSLLALTQWLAPEIKNLYIREVPYGGRVFANTGQPNHLATMLALGVASTLAVTHKISKNFQIFLIFILAFATSLTQSRTGILQFFAISFFTYILSEGGIKKKITLLFPSIFILISTYLVREISFRTELPIPRDILETGVQSIRTTHWLSLLEAFLKEPLLGYGWLHTAEAHLIGSNNAGKELILSYAHNIIFDFFLWFGIIGGVTFILTFILFFVDFNSTKEIKNPQIIGFTGFSIFFIHCLLEYPFSYLHILIPASIFLGISLQNCESNFLLKFKYKAFLFFITSFVFLITLIDYSKSIKSIEAMRFEYLGIINKKSEIKENKIIILDQLEGWMKNSYKLPSKEIGEKELIAYEKAALRYGTNRLILHAALANNYHGKIKESKYFINNLCKINTSRECEKYKILYESLKNK